MLKSSLLHPEILATLGSNGHGSRILIADGNFPFSTCTPKSAKKVFLNLAPGLLKVTDVLKVLYDHVPVETATVMVPADESSQQIHAEFQEILGPDYTLNPLKRHDFYDQAKSKDTCIVIATGETRRFANILLTIGVITT